MRELSLHLLDLVENSLEAGASLVEIEIVEDHGRNLLSMAVSDNGKGMDTEVVARATDPFYTTRTTRSVGMGIPLLRAAAQQCNGDLWVTSRQGEGTQVRAEFALDHIDRAPLGDLKATLMGILLSNRSCDVRYTHRVDRRQFSFDTRDLRAALGNVPLAHPRVRAWIEAFLDEGFAGLVG
ncbi:MAG: ATP-binding protein [Chloroflexi bacterium]|nr:ATP-binding protein [Chloroflexota bacterium]